MFFFLFLTFYFLCDKNFLLAKSILCATDDIVKNSNIFYANIFELQKQQQQRSKENRKKEVYAF